MSDIRLNQRTIGTLILDERRIRSEGGCYDARLVFPLTITMHPQPKGAMVAVTELRCSLHLSTPAFEGNRVGQTATVPLSGMNCRSQTQAPMQGSIEVRLPVTKELFAYLETHRHQHPERTFEAHLGFQGNVAWLSATGNVTPSQISDHAIDPDAGPFSILASFWYVNIGEIPLQVPASVSVNQVLPSLGFSSMRLVEITLPVASDALPENLLPLLDVAQRDYDLGHYRECIQKCRDVRNAVEQHLGATKQIPIATVMGNRLGLPPDAPQRTFLGKQWAGFADLTNAAHHLSTVQGMLRTDAHACLSTMAVLLEYISQLR
jgi:hypothetical protein